VQVLLLIVRLAVAITFAVAAVLKLLDRDDTAESIRQFGAPEPLVSAATVALPVVELLVAALLVPAPTAVVGAVAAAVLLTAFSAAILRVLSRGEAVACRCFGRHSDRPVGPRTLVRNGVLLLLSIWIAVSGTPDPVPSVLRDAWSNDAVRVTLGVVLVAAVVAEGLVIWQLLVSHGDVLRRLRDMEVVGSGGATPIAVPVHLGLPLGKPAPTFELTGLDGHHVRSSGLLGAGVPTLVLFTDPACGPCHELRPDLETWQHAMEGQLDVLLVSRGDLEANRADASSALASRTFVQHRDEVADAFRATGTPSAVIVDGDGMIGSGVVAGATAIRSLVQEQIDAMPLHGRLAPSIELLDLDGRPASPPVGRPYVVVFWSPSCGFCTAILDDVVASGVAMAGTEVDLFVVSTGSEDANRAQGLPGTVVLEPRFEVGRGFGALGTPSAVLVDEDGRCASELAIGGSAVLGLLAT
jgi:thiol-disulfide isomerase/thioredoxin